MSSEDRPGHFALGRNRRYRETDTREGAGSAPAAARSQSPPAPGPRLTTRTGSSRSSGESSGLRPETQERSAVAGTSSQSAAASVLTANEGAA